MTVQAQQEQIGQAQIAFRAQNEAIQASADSLGMLGKVPFVCECPNGDCIEIVRLSFDEYEAIRQLPRLFFNVSGHEQASVAAGAEKVVSVVGDLTIVEKIGIAGALASDAHDRAG